VRKVHASGQILLKLITDVLDFSKIEAGKLELERQQFHLADILDGVGAVVGVKAAEKELDLFFEIEHDVGLRRVGDANRLSQVLVNLAGNALKFTVKGEVLVRVKNEAPQMLRFEVADTGIGLSGPEKARLFQPFTQADASVTRRFGGTGLGLAISRQIVETMGGDIGVDSEPGQGSTFWFTARLPEQEPVPELQPSAAGTRVLVVDSQGRRRARVVEALRHAGAQVQESVLLDQASGPAPDVVVIDVQGAADAAVVRQRLPQARIILIVPATQDVVAQAQGAVTLSKPIHSKQLLDAVLNKAQLTAAVAAPAGSKSLSGMRVLLVEDNELNQEVAVGMLQRLDIEVEIAADGAEAVRMVNAAAAGYDAVLMDIQMPKLDGISATRMLRARYAADRLPIIAMTAHASQDERDRCAAVGMNEYLSKPVTVDRVQAVLRDFHRRSPASAPAARMAATVPPAAPLSSDQNPLPGLSTATAMAEFGFTPDLFRELVAKFHRQYENVVSEMDSAWDQCDFERLLRLAHTIRGSASYVGAQDTRAAAAEFEDAMRAGASLGPETEGMFRDLRGAAAIAIASAGRFATMGTGTKEGT
jgi:two-component system sensor histidine kinase/response regulator